MGTRRARSVAESAAGVLSSHDAGARSIVSAAVVEVVRGHDAAKAAFDAYMADPSGAGSREAFIAALADVMSTDASALDRVEEAVEKARSDQALSEPETSTGVTPLPPMVNPPTLPPLQYGEDVALPGSPSSQGMSERIERWLRRMNPFSSGGPSSSSGDIDDLEGVQIGHEEGVQVGPDAAVAGDPDPAGEPAATYSAFPYIRPTDQADDKEYLIRPRVPFPLEVGLNDLRPEPTILSTPGGVADLRAGMTVHVQLSYDPASLSIDGPTPIVLELTPDNPYPKHTVTVTPLPTAKPHNRRIAAHYMVDGKVRAIAFRTFRDVDAAPVEKPGDAELVDLTPLADEEAPDLVLAIYGADAASPGTFTMAAFPRDANVAPPEIGRIELGSDAADFMKQMFKEGNRAGDPPGSTTNSLGSGGASEPRSRTRSSER